MKIVACIKYSVDVSEVKVDRATRQLQLAGAPKRLGNIDRHVLETAAMLKQAHGGAVHIVCFGPQEAKNALKEALGMNGDDATLVVRPAHVFLDAAATVTVLARVVQRIGGCDLVVCGEASDDGFSYQVGPRLAERLGLPQLTYAREVVIEDRFIRAARHRGGSIDHLRAVLPVLLTVTEQTNTPRRPTLLDLLKAKQKPLIELSLDDLGLSLEVLAALSRLELCGTEGVVVERKGILLRNAPPASLANELVERLLHDNVFRGLENE